MSRFLLLMLCWLPLVAGAQVEPATVWQGVYAESQAERGQQHYLATCSSCHGADLRGNSNAPALRGVSFTFLWEGRSLGELFATIRDQMPTDRPGSLSPQVVADILGYLLSVNDYPPGETELLPEPAVLNAILITPPAN